MMQANPQLTPNAVKAILQYTAEVYAGYDALTEGAGFVNAKGAVALARQFATTSTKQYRLMRRDGLAPSPGAID